MEYSDIETDVQTIVYNLIKDNKVLSYNVLDGRPEQMIRMNGFPYVLVHTPERNDEKMLTHRIRLIPLEMTIEIFCTEKESLLRSLTGEVLGILHANQRTTRGNKIFKYKTAKTNFDIDFTENIKIFKMTCTINYEVSVLDQA